MAGKKQSRGKIALVEFFIR